MADGTLKVGTITTSSGSGNITIGSGVTVNVNRPAFEAYLSANQAISDSVLTKVQHDTEVFDTDGCYDSTTNYRFTPTEPGKYYVYVVHSVSAANATEMVTTYNYIRKNGSTYKFNVLGMNGNYGTVFDVVVTATVDMNGTTDYLEAATYADVSANTPTVQGSANKRSYFGAYKIGA